MNGVFYKAEDLIGNTPLLELKNVEKEYRLKAKIFAKLEYFNPAGSVKDRVAKYMLDDAEERGASPEKSVIIEPTSGNTGIGLAAIGAARGYRVIIVMPDSMSIERRRIMKAYGAELVLTDGKLGMKGAIAEAERLVKTVAGGFIPSQFTNPANPRAHFETTGPEIYNALGGKVDYLVAGVGTGGTISGAGKFLKSKISGVKVVAVEPAGSPVISCGTAGKHKIQGIGAGFIPQTFDRSVCDEVITVSDEDAFKLGRTVGRKEGVLVGISSGAALYAAVQVALREENAGKNIAVIFPDTGDRYLSSEMFE